MMCWQDLLKASPSQIYKHDGRSRVWRVDSPQQGSVVIKRFEHSPLRQRVAMLLGVHPAQAEMRKALALAHAKIPVVPIMGMHVQNTGTLGVKVHLATRWLGVSLQQAMKEQRPLVTGECQREKIMACLGELAASLLLAGWVFRDLKTSNLLIDDQGRLRLIDVGSARNVGTITSGSAPARAWRMLWMLNHTLTQDGWSKAQRIACLARPLAVICSLPVKLAHDKLEKMTTH